MSSPKLRVAVVGSGPAGLLRGRRASEERRPARRGRPARPAADAVGPRPPRRRARPPEHQGRLARLREDRGASPGFRFFGNVEVGRDVSHDELVELYDAVVYTVGAQTDRRLGIPGEDLPGSWPATAFVAWYNGHPDFQDLEFDLSDERAVVIGNGNVAVDCVRMLALTPRGARPDRHDRRGDRGDRRVGRSTEIVMLGRRGPVQAAFTPPELKELGELAGADVLVDPADLELDPASERGARGRPRARAPQPRPAAGVRRTRARRQAEAARPAVPRPRRSRFAATTGSRRSRSCATSSSRRTAGSSRGPTGETETIECGIVLRSVGYQGVPLAGVPFDEATGTIPNDARPGRRRRANLRGRLDQARPERRDRHEQEGRDGDGRGAARGRRAGTLDRTRASDGALETLLEARGIDFVEYEGWQAIDAAERAAGEPLGRPRVKLGTWDESATTAAARPDHSAGGRAADADGPMVSQMVECLNCGERRRALPEQECPRCSYVGWALVEELDEALRRLLRDRSLAEPPHSRGRELTSTPWPTRRRTGRSSGAARPARRSGTSRSPASRSRRRSPAGSAGSRPPPRA